VPEPESTSAGELAKGNNNGEQAKLDSDPKARLVGANSVHDTGAAGLTLNPRNSEGVGRGEVCGLLIERPHVVSTPFRYILYLTI
jgi:hypothetical protein